MENIKQFQNKIDSAIKELDITQIINSATSFPISCSDLDEGYDNSKALNSKLNDIKPYLSTVYWFEITPVDPKELTKRIDRLRQEGKYKVPPTNQKNISDNILYVGKVRKNFRGRVLQHLGYRSPATWSLQLRHWSKDLIPNLNISIHYIQFSEGENYPPFAEEIENISLAILEQRVAEKLKPILGKHSL